MEAVPLACSPNHLGAQFHSVPFQTRATFLPVAELTYIFARSDRSSGSRAAPGGTRARHTCGKRCGRSGGRGGIQKHDAAPHRGRHPVPSPRSALGARRRGEGPPRGCGAAGECGGGAAGRVLVAGLGAFPRRAVYASLPPRRLWSAGSGVRVNPQPFGIRPLCPMPPSSRLT